MSFVCFVLWLQAALCARGMFGFCLEAQVLISILACSSLLFMEFTLDWLAGLCVTAEGVRMLTTRSGAWCNAGQTHQDKPSFLFDFQEKYMAVVFNVFVKWWLGRNALP